ncbi:MAG TPA: arginine--tRNA ligase [Dissulfurispiraceae bacterium]|nr:arginine--tRNA ligase [Dissulfurispiraceae bacterium]
MEKAVSDVLNAPISMAFGGPNSYNTPLDTIEIVPPKDEGLGDLSTPLAMSLTKLLKKPPRLIAEDVVKAIGVSGVFEKIEIAGPGFINFTFTRSFLYKELQALLASGEAFLTEDVGRGRKIQIEFVSSNPTGPMHLGHGRGAALGAALSNLLSEAGYTVEKEFYINDAGRQVRLLGESVFAKYKNMVGTQYFFPQDGYRGDYIEDIAKEIREKHGNEFEHKDFKDVRRKFVDFSYQKMLELIKKDLEDFGVFFDTWQSERELYEKGEVKQAIEDLRERGYIFEEADATWFRSTAFGDDKDRVLIKKDGEYTYFAPDIAYHRKKVARGFDELIDIWGADHHGYVPRMQAVIQALGCPKDRLRVLLVQMVSLVRGGQPVPMSKRSGEFITLREVMEDIGADTTKFLFLTRRSDSHLEVDIEVAKAQSSENPVYYVQYANARINSIFEKAKQESEAGFPAGDMEQYLAAFNGESFNDEEMRILKKLLLYPMMFRDAALAHEPHRITFYLQELAGMFHPYYHKYKVITGDVELTRARLALCQAIQIVLRHGLKILGVKAPERM